ncbi:uncharacterized protein [Amphiura filiformis]|uniref:uncharacterized protein n=1 Tax=Amphiura filiformis TaxID=82378 RepID=UPI003B211F6E
MASLPPLGKPLLLIAKVDHLFRWSLSFYSTAKSETAPSTPNRNNNSATTSPNHGGLQLLGFNLKKSGFSGLDANRPTTAKGLSNAAQEIRLKLLQLLEKRGPTFLVSHGCPFSQGAVTQLMQGKYLRPIYMEKLQAFYQWYNVYNGLMDNTLVSADKLDNMMPAKPSSRHWRRPRTLFDPRHELPRLLAWYRDNPRPSRAEMEMYLAELNTMERRRNGHPLQYTSIAIWFKNARAKYRGLGE